MTLKELAVKMAPDHYVTVYSSSDKELFSGIILHLMKRTDVDLDTSVQDFSATGENHLSIWMVS